MYLYDIYNKPYTIYQMYAIYLDLFLFAVAAYWTNCLMCGMTARIFFTHLAKHPLAILRTSIQRAYHINK